MSVWAAAGGTPDRPGHVAASELVPLAKYRREVLGSIGPLEPIHLGLLEAFGAVCAEDVTSPTDLPPFVNSAMDGYAVDAGSVTVGEQLHVVGEIAAGSGELVSPGPGQAVRIMTGAPLPPGADAVVPVELVSEGRGTVTLQHRPEAGDHVRPSGQDVRAGQVVIPQGARLGPAEIAMCAAVGKARVLAHPQPRVVVVSTGDELVEPDREPGPGQIRDSNSYMLTAAVREAGAAAFRQPIVPDDRKALAEAFEGAMSQADMLLTSGGVSAGRYDLVREVLSQLGNVRFTKVGMQPGMPQAFGYVGSVPCFGLPGNPVSAYVSFEVFVRPSLRRLQGRNDLNRPRVVALLDEPVTSPPSKVSFLRVRLRREGGDWFIRPTGGQGSGLLGSIVAADGLAEVPADRTSVEAGEPLVVHLLVDAT